MINEHLAVCSMLKDSAICGSFSWHVVEPRVFIKLPGDVQEVLGQSTAPLRDPLVEDLAVVDINQREYLMDLQSDL